ncbi:TIGR03619 family F420-dependent LLM class oxidoreductase [Actinomadura sp. 6N118]|uniref:TIGR03619 family F420-dependent LLM class oxidoreductase n=1 Tax=Actinomadura sp. 6N118 TaxID=3375151 RepID=UPI00378B0441
MTTPTIGLFGANLHACAEPFGAARVAALAEELGYDSLWVADHPALPSPRTEQSPMEPDEPLLEPVVALAHLAAHTERILLGTGCVVLPQRNPVILAKQLAGIDVLSRGRLVFGVAVGYLEAEMRAIGIPMEGRGARADEYLQAMSSLWYDEKPEFHGEYVDFEGVDAYPRPVQHPVPVVVGGHSPAAHRRAARHGAWMGWLLGLRATAEQLAALRATEATVHVSVVPQRRLDPDVVRAYGELGVDRLIAIPPLGLRPEELIQFVTDHAPERLEARAV